MTLGAIYLKVGLATNPNRFVPCVCTHVCVRVCDRARLPCAHALNNASMHTCRRETETGGGRRG